MYELCVLLVQIAKWFKAPKTSFFLIKVTSSIQMETLGQPQPLPKFLSSDFIQAVWWNFTVCFTQLFPLPAYCSCREQLLVWQLILATTPSNLHGFTANCSLKPWEMVNISQGWTVWATPAITQDDCLVTCVICFRVIFHCCF